MQTQKLSQCPLDYFKCSDNLFSTETTLKEMGDAKKKQKKQGFTVVRK